MVVSTAGAQLVPCPAVAGVLVSKGVSPRILVAERREEDLLPSGVPGGLGSDSFLEPILDMLDTVSASTSWLLCFSSLFSSLLGGYFSCKYFYTIIIIMITILSTSFLPGPVLRDPLLAAGISCEALN